MGFVLGQPEHTPKGCLCAGSVRCATALCQAHLLSMGSGVEMRDLFYLLEGFMSQQGQVKVQWGLSS
jgi:hypothetical protein